jgi:hypothetical protein
MARQLVGCAAREIGVRLGITRLAESSTSDAGSVAKASEKTEKTNLSTYKQSFRETYV